MRWRDGCSCIWNTRCVGVTGAHVYARLDALAWPALMYTKDAMRWCDGRSCIRKTRCDGVTSAHVYERRDALAWRKLMYTQNPISQHTKMALKHSIIQRFQRHSICRWCLFKLVRVAVWSVADCSAGFALHEVAACTFDNFACDCWADCMRDHLQQFVDACLWFFELVNERHFV